MKKSIVFIILVFSLNNFVYAQPANEMTIELARSFARSLFEHNGVNYMQPVVKVVNATSNSRFYSDAYIPRKTDKPYFRFGVHSMLGLVPNDMKTFTPYLPNEKFDMLELVAISGLTANEIYDLPNWTWEEIQERMNVADVIHYFFLNLMYSGMYDDNGNPLDNPDIAVPKKASTALGNLKSKIYMPNDKLQELAQKHPIYQFLPEEFKDTINNVLNVFPNEFDLTEGSNMNRIFALVPQIEIGSLYGTELLLRFIPPVDMGKTIGKFAFWGVGLKHSITQYFDGPMFDAAVQVVYQGSHLENTVGATNAELKADATFFNFNIHASKNINDNFYIFSGLAYETIGITSSYKYYLPIVVQRQLGLIAPDQEKPTPGYPGDQDPQTTNLTLDDAQFKWTLGLAKYFGNFGVVADFSISKFNIFSLGLTYRLN